MPCTALACEPVQVERQLTEPLPTWPAESVSDSSGSDSDPDGSDSVSVDSNDNAADSFSD